MITEGTSALSRPRQIATVAALLACGVSIALGLYAPGPVLPQVSETFAAVPNSKLLTQLITVVPSFVFALSAPFAGGLVGRIGCKRIIIPSVIVFVIAGTLPAVLDDLWAILAARAVVGVCIAGIYTSGLAGISAFPPERRAALFGWLTVTAGLGAVLSFSLVATLATHGWRAGFLLYLAGLAIIPLALTMPRALGKSGAAHAVEHIGHGTVDPLFTPALIGLLAMVAFLGLNLLISPVYAPIYLSRIGITDPQLLALPATAGAISSTIAAAAYGYLVRRLGVNGLTALFIAVMGVALICVIFTSSLTMFTIAILVHNAASALLGANFNNAALASVSPARGSQALGLQVGMLFGIQLLFPFIVTAIEEAFGLPAVFVIDGVLAMAIALTVVVLTRSFRRRAIPV